MGRIPSTQALRILESFARHNSIGQVAAEMKLTRSAVSHQLRILERDLKFPIFRLAGTTTELTLQGRSFAEDARTALWTIAGSVARYQRRGVAGSLTISCGPEFTSFWLFNRLHRFSLEYPDVSISHVTPRKLGDVSDPNVALFITFSDGNLPGMDADLLFDVYCTPVCSPGLANSFDGPLAPEDVLQGGLLHLSDYSLWASWLEQNGLDPKRAREGIVFSEMHLAYAAALTGQGFALGDVAVAQDAFNSGRLLRPFAHAIRDPCSTYVAVPKALIHYPVVVAFRDWLLDEARKASAPPRQSRAIRSFAE